MAALLKARGGLGGAPPAAWVAHPVNFILPPRQRRRGHGETRLAEHAGRRGQGRIEPGMRLWSSVSAERLEALEAIAPAHDALEQLGVRHHVGGSISSSVYGVPRATADVDLMAELREDLIGEILQRFRGDYYLDESAIREALTRSHSFNLIHLGTLVKVDIFIPKRKLESFPFFPSDLSLAQNPREELCADIGAMRVRKGNSHLTATHELVLATRSGALEAQLPQMADQVTPLDGTEGRQTSGRH